MNWNMLGHTWAVELLRQHVAQDRPRHAYLITGPQGLGRRTLALRLAQALNCPQPTAPGEPCGACRTCTQLEQMQHPDLAVVQAEQEGGTLKVDAIRELQRGLALAPYAARYRVALLLRFEEANDSAANALLKTLEEPPAQVILILTAENAERLLPTIVSRCELLRLRPLSLDETSQGLQTRWGLPPAEAEELAHLSGGRPGYALRLHQDPERVEQHRSLLDDQSRLLAANRVERFAYVEPLFKDKERVEWLPPVLLMLQTWATLWRDVLLRAAGAAAPLTNLARTAEIEALAATLDLNTAHRALAAIERAQIQIEQNVNGRLALEVLMLELPKVKSRQ